MNLKVSITSIFILFSVQVYSQTNLKYYADFGLKYCYRNYSLNESESSDLLIPANNALNIFEDYYNAYEEPRLGVDFNIGLVIEKNEKVKFRSGIGFQEIGETVKLYLQTEVYQYEGILIPVHGSEMTPHKFKNTLRYAFLNGDFQYVLLKKNKILFGGEIGAKFNYLVDKNTVNYFSTFNPDLKYTLADYSKLALSLNGGLFANYAFNGRIEGQIRLNYNRFLSPNIRYRLYIESIVDCMVYQKNYALSLNFGFVYKI